MRDVRGEKRYEEDRKREGKRERVRQIEK